MALLTASLKYNQSPTPTRVRSPGAAGAVGHKLEMQAELRDQVQQQGKSKGALRARDSQ